MCFAFEIFEKCSESVGFGAHNNELHEKSEFFKSDTFENYKCFVPAEVQNPREVLTYISVVDSC